MTSIAENMTNQNNTVNANDLANFEHQASTWWDRKGPHSLLHRMNPLRLSYLLDHVPQLPTATVLDIGCGGGLLSVPLARLGAQVTGIDTSPKTIQVAQDYAKGQDLSITYTCTPIEDFVLDHEQSFDLVCASEVVEHVDNLPVFLEKAVACLKPGGHLFISTVNRTLTSYALAILGAETLLRWVPKGTHDWTKFLKPSEIIEPLDRLGLKPLNLQGVRYNPFFQEWSLTKNLDMNYFLIAQKKP